MSKKRSARKLSNPRSRTNKSDRNWSTMTSRELAAATKEFDKEFIAYGLYNPDSNIQVRLYSWEHGRPLDDNMISERI